MAGLLGAMLAGGVKSVANGRLADMEQQEKFDYEMAMMNARAEKEMRLKEYGIQLEDKTLQAREQRNRDTNISDANAISAKSEMSLANDSIQGLGVGGSVDAESLQALKDNPEALQAYRNSGAKGLLSPSRLQQAEADVTSATSVGRLDIAKSRMDDAKGERSEIKDDNRYDLDVKRLAQQDKDSERRFNLQMKAQDRQITAMENANEKESARQNLEQVKMFYQSADADVKLLAKQIENMMPEDPSYASAKDDLVAAIAKRDSASDMIGNGGAVGGGKFGSLFMGEKKKPTVEEATTNPTKESVISEKRKPSMIMEDKNVRKTQPNMWTQTKPDLKMRGDINLPSEYRSK